MLKIDFIKNNGTTEIIVDDNGIGRKKATENKHKSTGVGLKNLTESLKFYNKENKKKIEFEIIDKIENKIAKGTMVKILIK